MKNVKFTLFLLSVLLAVNCSKAQGIEEGKKFLYYEKYISAKDLWDSFYKAILSNSDNLPQYSAIKGVGDEGGEFIFIQR